ncbi:uncharacterized protein F4807DRAFT_455419 [Annulohypoxylon truncatum]|uniref:uncharacterized protein n=1 Tax=Annulohypoxylon truncatum TaxID=327061 RepID=UPI002007CAAF|nr:uncharacterized protein F4807DRAFT_455419 [Annulohypoxylon truncatum]KAI1214970.1 hypothetical protein F4807DRAFT_455419 [Annulohypoxylon truncatum]
MAGDPQPTPPGSRKIPLYWPIARAPIPATPAPRIYRYTATALGASMWFFLMYRAKKDGPVLMGWKHPWDH